MKPETAFYAMGAWGSELGRVAAIARHVPDAVVYVYGRSNARNLFGYHDITTVVPRCLTPGCTGLNNRDLAGWLRNRDPVRLVMDGQPYGVLESESQPYLQTRRDRPTYYLHYRRNQPPTFDAGIFNAVLKTDVEPDLDGVDLYPTLPFDCHELPARSDARGRLGGGDKPIVMIVGEGTTPNYSEFVIRQCRLRGLDYVIVNTYPVMPLMPGADFIVGYVGFSQVEAAAVGVPMIGITNMADPNQSWRANATPNELADAIAALEVRDVPETVSYTNYARRAAALISGYPDWGSVNG